MTASPKTMIILMGFFYSCSLIKICDSVNFLGQVQTKSVLPGLAYLKNDERHHEIG